MSETRAAYLPRAVRVTARELEVMRLVARGRTYKQIGLDLGITERTVIAYVQKLKFSFGANTLAQLLYIMQSEHLI